MSDPVTSQYKATEIKVLEGLEPVRKRPGMYIGSTDGRGLHHLAKEILDNAVDEAIAGYGKTIKLFRTPVGESEVALMHGLKYGDEAITVVDNGRGIPVDMHASGVSALEVVMTKLHAGGKFEETAYQASGGLHGVGSSAVNALSSLVQVVVKRDGKFYYQGYSQGRPHEAVKTISLTEVKKFFPVQAEHFVDVSTGTMIKFVPDPTIFSTVAFGHKTLVGIIKDRAYLMAGIYFQLIDTIEGLNQHYYFESGIRSLVEHINMSRKPLHGVFYNQDTYEDPETHKKIGVELALQFNDSFQERLESYVNVIHTPDGGAHVNGFRMALGRVLRDYATAHSLLKEKEAFTAEDLKEGLAAVIFVKMPSNDLQFESQTKTKLNNAEAQSAVYQIFKDGFTTYLEEHPKAGKAIIDKIMLSARARMAARAAKDAVVRKGLFEGSSLPGKLADCQSRRPEESEIYIVEGDSAGGCFSGDTKVALADGRAISFTQMVDEQSQGKEHFVYTIRASGKVGIQKALHARVTKKNAEVILVKLDNGEEITCTPDHPFMLRNGQYKRADQLTTQDSLMPLYRKFSDKTAPGITIDGYEMVWDPSSDSWLFTHVLADWYNRWHQRYTKSSGAHCHHIDFDKHNNNPSNIIRLTAEDHLSLHREHVSKTLHRPEVIEKSRQLHKTPQFRAAMSARMQQPRTKAILSAQAKAQWQDEAYKQYMKDAWRSFFEGNQAYREFNKEQLQAAQEEYWNKPENRTAQSQKTIQFFQAHPERKLELSQLAKRQWNDQELLAWRSAKTHSQWTPEFRQKRKNALAKTYYTKSIAALKRFEKNGVVDVSAYNADRKASRDKSLLTFGTLVENYFAGSIVSAIDTIQHFNHKIVSITKLSQKIDVYDIEVPQSHNFALASGVFVHNSAKQGRDRKFQAIFPLRGKILNTERARLDKVVAFEELKNLVIALGAGIGDTFDVKNLRYHRIILMNDADVDGEHITTLGLTFFFRHLPEVVKEGYLYVAMPPLYKVSYNKQDKYAYSDEEKDALVEQIKKDSPKATIGIQRYKGLGEMNPEQLWETTMNPTSRMLKRISIEDADKADQVFSTLMGDDVVPRKKFIQARAKLANLDI